MDEKQFSEVKAKMIEEAKEFHGAENGQDNIEELADASTYGFKCNGCNL